MDANTINPTDLGKIILALAVIAPILTAIGYFLGRKRMVEIGNTVKTEHIAGVATRDELSHLTDRVEKVEQKLEKLRDDIGSQYKAILEAGETRAEALRKHISTENNTIHARLNVAATAIATMQGYIDAKLKERK